MTFETLLELYDEQDCMVWVGLRSYNDDLIYKGTVETILEKYPFLADTEVLNFHYVHADEFNHEEGLDITVYEVSDKKLHSKPAPTIYAAAANLLCQYGFNTSEEAVKQWYETQMKDVMEQRQHLIQLLEKHPFYNAK